MAGWVIANGSANSKTVASPEASRARMARLVGSESAENVASSCCEDFITIPLYNNRFMYKDTTSEVNTAMGLGAGRTCQERRWPVPRNTTIVAVNQGG